MKELKEAFPELAKPVNSWDGLLHLEMAEVRRFAQHLIDTGRREELSTCFSIVERYQREGNRRLQNAVDVSFVEDLDFSDTGKHERRWAWELLPCSLQDLYESFHGQTGA